LNSAESTGKPEARDATAEARGGPPGNGDRVALQQLQRPIHCFQEAIQMTLVVEAKI